MNTDKASTIQLTPCDSSAMVAHGYDADARLMEIQFRAGHAPHTYHDVPPEVYEGLLTATSKVQYLAQHIRGKYNPPKAEA